MIRYARRGATRNEEAAADAKMSRTSTIKVRTRQIEQTAEQGAALAQRLPAIGYGTTSNLRHSEIERLIHERKGPAGEQ